MRILTDFVVLLKTELDYGVPDPTKLVLNNVTLSDAGKYACRVTNAFGDVNSSVILTVLQPTATSGKRCFSFYVTLLCIN